MTDNVDQHENCEVANRLGENDGNTSDADENGSVDLFANYDSASISDESGEGVDSGKVLLNKEKACKKILDDFYRYLTSAD